MVGELDKWIAHAYDRIKAMRERAEHPHHCNNENWERLEYLEAKVDWLIEKLIAEPAREEQRKAEAIEERVKAWRESQTRLAGGGSGLRKGKP